MMILLVCILLTDNFGFIEAGRRYGIDPLLLKAISIVESNMRPVIRINKNGTADYGHTQINTLWIEKLNLNRARLLSDPTYATFATAYILSKLFKKYGYSWDTVGRYHSMNPNLRKKYALKVMKTYKKLRSKYGNSSELKIVEGSIR